MAKGKFLKPRFWVLVMLVLLVLFGASILARSRVVQRQRETLARLEAERMLLLDEVNELTRQKEYMETDEYVERAARERLGMLLPDEIRYVPGAP